MNKQENSIFLNLTIEQKIDLIGGFYEWYFSTDQDTEEFAPEYYHLTNDILNGSLPLSLNFLVDYEVQLLELLDTEQQQQYTQAKNKLK